MKIRYDVISDVGLRRDNNEDMALIFGAFVRDDAASSTVRMDSNPRFTAIVADGMGGYGGGEIASEITLRSFDQFILNLPPGLDDRDIRLAVNDWLTAHQRIIFERQTRPGLAHMGTTLTGIFIYDRRTYMINAGDSRVYRWRDGNLRQLSVDHSERQRTGNPNVPSNLIYNAIGVPDAFITITLLDDRYPIIDGDTYIICSDGLNDMISDDDIAHILAAGGSTRALIDAALHAGGADNCTIIRLDIINPAETTDTPPAPTADTTHEPDTTIVPQTPQPIPPQYDEKQVINEIVRPLFQHHSPQQPQPQPQPQPDTDKDTDTDTNTATATETIETKTETTTHTTPPRLTDRLKTARGYLNEAIRALKGK